MSPNLVQQKRNSLLRHPGFICGGCGAKMRSVDSKRVLYAYLVGGLVFLLFNVVAIISKPVDGSAWGLGAVCVAVVAYAIIKLRQPIPKVSR